MNPPSLPVTQCIIRSQMMVMEHRPIYQHGQLATTDALSAMENMWHQSPPNDEFNMCNAMIGHHHEFDMSITTYNIKPSKANFIWYTSHVPVLMGFKTMFHYNLFVNITVK